MAFYQSSPQPLTPGQRLADDDSLNAFFAKKQVSVTYNQTATGANFAGAIPVPSGITQFSVVGANTGALLQLNQAGQSQDIYNDGANPLTVYAPFGYTVDGAASVPLANGKRATFTCMAPGIIQSAQLGAVSA